MRRLKAAGVIALGLLLSGGAVALVLTSNHEDDLVFVIAALLLSAWSFILGGLLAWARRPENRFGPLLVAVGLTVFIGALSASNSSLPFTLGYVFGGVFIAVFIHALMAFPRGYLETRIVYAIVAVAYLALTVGSLLASLFDDVSRDCPDCPPNAFLIVDSPAAVSAIDALLIAVGIPALLAALYVFRRRWNAAPAPLRRLLLPVYLTAGATLVLLGIGLVVGTFSEGGARVVSWIVTFTFAAVPLAFIVGLLGGRLARGGVSQLVLELGQAHAPGDLREALARALGDANLRLAYWIPETASFADLDGSPVELPEGRGEQLARIVELDGRPVAALIHHRSLEDDPLFVEAVAAAAALALENERRLVALRKAQARIQALVDAFPDLIFRMSRDGEYLDYKGKTEDLAVPPDELIGAKAHEILPLDVADQLVGGIRRAIDTGEVVTGEYELELDGVPRDWEARIVKAGDEAVLIAREFTERNRAQAELARLHAELQQRHRDLEHERDFIRTVVDSAPSLLCLTTPGGYIIRFNTSLERLSGRSDNDFVRGYAFWDVFIAPEERESVQRAVERVVAEGGRGEFESAWITVAGDRRKVTWSTTPLRDDKGDRRLLISGMDITERIRHEEELRRSRARLVEASDVERRRLERNLHDGAQQRLVSLSLMLRLAQARVEDDPVQANNLLGQASQELAQALEELRELARGIHPAVLSDRGLGAALEALVSRTPLPVELELLDARLPEPVEAAAYYVVSEALANVAKYAEASSVAVSIASVNGHAVVEIADDGVGGADPTKGSGLRGLVDRVEALDGRLEVESASGQGTRIRVEIPCG
jgi:PAS domain S-box-containing protein